MLRIVLVGGLTAAALLFAGTLMPGLLLASLALALSIRPPERTRIADVVMIAWSSLVLLTFNFAQFQAWQALLTPG